MKSQNYKLQLHTLPYCQPLYGINVKVCALVKSHLVTMENGCFLKEELEGEGGGDQLT